MKTLLRRSPGNEGFKSFYRIAFAILILLLMSFQQVSAQFRVVGYVPSWGGNLNDVQYSKLTHINYAFLIPTTSGGYQAPDANRLKTLVSLAHAQNVKVIISVGGGGGGDAFRSICPNASLRTTFVNNMMNFVNQYNLDGVDIDWEFPNTGTEANNFSLLMQELYAKMHSNGKLCTIAVIAYGGTSIINSVFNAIDFLNIMAYDENSYDHSTYDLAVKSVNYWVGRGLPANKAVLGVPFYGRDNCCDYKTVGYNDILAMGGSPNADTYNNKIGYNGIPTMKKKTAYAIQACGGIMIWSLDTDVLGANSLLSAINEVVVANSNPVPDNLAKGKPVSVSSTEANSNVSTAGSNATDGSYSTRWSSLFADPQWLSVDLGATYAVNRVKITWEAAYAKDYQIQISTNGTDWSVLKSVTGNSVTSNDQTALSGTGRYVRIYGTSRATAYGYSIMELEVYGTPIESPFSGTAINLPGKIEAENYDLGGQGLAYNDADASNQGGAYRTEGVDIQATTDAGGGYNVGYTSAGEWLKYMVNVTASGTYSIGFRTAATSTTGSIRMEVDGQDVTGTVALPNTGGWQTWATTKVSNVALTAGAHMVRVFIVNAGFNLNYVEVTSDIPNQTPSASITSPVNGDTLTAPASIVINANAADADGTINKVDFYNGTTLLGSDGTAPYSYTWSNVAVGTYVVSVKATDNAGASVQSESITLVVKKSPVNQLPIVSITTPVNNASYDAPASIAINVSASDVDGAVSKVEFYNGTTLLGSDVTAPYSVTWTNVGAGTYSLTAKVTDDSGASVTSSAVSVKVNTVVVSNPCASIPQYKENNGYVAGSKVQMNGKQYQCKPYPYSGWCNGAAWAYAPGTGSYWGDAWTLIGTCSAKQSAEMSTNSANINSYPNPFNNVTSVDVVVEDAGDVEVKVYDKTGKIVATLVEGYLSTGTHTFSFDASNLNPDLYLIKFNIGDKVFTRKVVKMQ